MTTEQLARDLYRAGVELERLHRLLDRNEIKSTADWIRLHAARDRYHEIAAQLAATKRSA